MHSIAVLLGDGIGPEIMEATLHVLKEAGGELDIHYVEMGEKVYLRGIETGIEPHTWETIRGTSAFLKAPTTTPQGGGFKSLNVTVRNTLGLYANVRPTVAYAPFIKTLHPGMDVVIIRENEEDLYVGIEYRQTPDVVMAQKLTSRQGSERIHRYAFEYARHHGRKKVTCFTKDNILKLSDGLFHHVYDEISKEYPDILNEHWIIDIGTAKFADAPENFDVVVLPNLYGDILSDVAAQISGSVGVAPSANIGEQAAMFEAIHGSAPRMAGKNKANPSALLLSSVMMMAYLGEVEVAKRIHDAWLATIEEGIHTYDIFDKKNSQVQVGTKEFGEAVVKNLGNQPRQLHSPSYKTSSRIMPLKASFRKDPERKLIGVDFFIYSKEKIKIFQEKIGKIDLYPFKLQMITNRGAQVWPDNHPGVFCIEQMRCRFINGYNQGGSIEQQDIVKLINRFIERGFDVTKTENLYTFDGLPGYSSAEAFIPK